VHNHDGQRIPPVLLPVTVTQNLYSRLNLNQALLSGRQNDTSREKKTSQGLKMSAMQAATRQEGV
jgi:hypothetical protein